MGGMWVAVRLLEAGEQLHRDHQARQRLKRLGDKTLEGSGEYRLGTVGGKCVWRMERKRI